MNKRSLILKWFSTSVSKMLLAFFAIDIYKEIVREGPFDIRNIWFFSSPCTLLLMLFVANSYEEPFRSHIQERPLGLIWMAALLPLLCLAIDGAIIFLLWPTDAETRKEIFFLASAAMTFIVFAERYHDFFFLRRWWPIKKP